MNKLASLLVFSLASACSASVIHNETPADAGPVAQDSGTLTDTSVNAVHDASFTEDTGPMRVVTPPGDGGMTVSPPPSTDAGVPVPCPDSVSGNGLACNVPGEGCGSTSAGPCPTSISCACGSDFTWYCAESELGDCDGGISPPPFEDGGIVPPTEDGGVIPPTLDGGSPPSEDAGVCTVVGSWSVRSSTEPTVTIVFGITGTWQVFPDSTGLPATMPVTGGSYTVTDGQISLVQTIGLALTGCTASQVGVYDLGFSPDCRTLSLATVSEPCSGRSAILSTDVFIAL